MEREQIRRAIDYVIESNLLFFVSLIVSIFGIDFLNQLYRTGIQNEMEKLLEGGTELIGTTTGMAFRDFLGRLVVVGNPRMLPPTQEHRQEIIDYATERIRRSFPNWLDKVVRGFPRGTSATEFINEFTLQALFILLYAILVNWEDVKDYLRRINNQHLHGEGKTHRKSFLKKYKLEDTGYSLEDLSKITQFPIKILQEVYNRGIGAYKTNPQSVRIKGTFKKGIAPMSKKLSKEQWAMARVYSFLDGSKKHDQDLFEE